MTPETWANIWSHYRMLKALKDDLPDGMWDDIAEAADAYLTAKFAVTDGDPVAINALREQFLEDLNEVLIDYGYAAYGETA